MPNGKPGVFSLRTFTALLSVIGVIVASAFYVGVTKAGIDGNKENIIRLDETDKEVHETVSEIDDRLIRVEIRQEIMADNIGEIKAMNKEILSAVRGSIAPGVSG